MQGIFHLKTQPNPANSSETTLIDVEGLLENAKQKRDRAAVVAFSSLQERIWRAMSIPGPKKGLPLAEQKIVGLIHEEIRDRRDSNEFIAPSQSSYADNQYIIKTLNRLLPR